jgi:hypothetical protein
MARIDVTADLKLPMFTLNGADLISSDWGTIIIPGYGIVTVFNSAPHEDLDENYSVMIQSIAIHEEDAPFPYSDWPFRAPTYFGLESRKYLRDTLARLDAQYGPGSMGGGGGDIKL